MSTQSTTIRCSNCGNPFPAEINSVIDVGQTPEAKERLLAGTLNNAVCPTCNTLNKVVTPLLYHDPAKELLIALVPMEVNATKDQQEKIVGEMMNQLPKENFKAYMFNPRRALTMQGLIDQVLEADGISPDDWRKQQEGERAKVDLMQTLMEATDEATLTALVKEHDAQLDEDFFNTTNRMIHTTMQNGRPDVAQQLMMMQNALLQMSTFGQTMVQKQRETVQQVTEAVQNLGQGANRDNFFDLALEYADDEDRLAVLVQIARPVFDEQFMQEMNLKIGQLPAQAREKVEHLRERIEDLIEGMDQQDQAQAVALLQAIVNHPQPEEALRANISSINDAFIQVLRMNIENAEAQQNLQAAARLKQVEQMIQQIMSEMQNTTVFLRQLLGSQDPEALLRDNLDQIDDNLLTVLMMNIESAQQNGDAGPAQRLTALYNLAVSILQENMSPEMKLINELLTADDDATAQKLLEERADEVDDNLLQVMDSVEQMLRAQGAEPLLNRLQALRKTAQKTLEG